MAGTDGLISEARLQTCELDWSFHEAGLVGRYDTTGVSGLIQHIPGQTIAHCISVSGVGSSAAAASHPAGSPACSVIKEG
jgi:hypothetical protein